MRFKSTPFSGSILVESSNEKILTAPAGLIDLPGGGILVSAVKLRHQTHFFPIAVSKRSTRARPKSCPGTLSPALQPVG